MAGSTNCCDRCGPDWCNACGAVGFWFAIGHGNRRQRFGGARRRFSHACWFATGTHFRADCDAGFVGIATVIMWPVQVGVRWVWWVAEIFARLKVDGVANIALWIGVFVAILLMRHRSSSV